VQPIGFKQPLNLNIFVSVPIKSLKKSVCSLKFFILCEQTNKCIQKIKIFVQSAKLIEQPNLNGDIIPVRVKGLRLSITK